MGNLFSSFHNFNSNTSSKFTNIEIANSINYVTETLDVTEDINTNYREQFNKNGYVLLRNYFTQEEGDNLVKYANELEEWKEEAFKWMIYFEKNEEDSRLRTRLENFLEFHPELKQLFKTKLHPLVNNICETQMNLFKEKMNWKNPNGKGFRPHQDQPAWTDFPPKRFVSLAIFGNNATVANGCL